MSNRKKMVTISLIVATLVLAFSALIIGYQMVEAQSKMQYLERQIVYYRNMTANVTANVTMQNISVGLWHPDALVGAPYYKDINITVINNGFLKPGGMVLDAKVQGNNTNLDPFGIYISNQIGVLHIQESKSMSVRLIVPTIDRADILSEYNLSITLRLDGNVLDRQTVEIGR
jgi:hypothetical protein